MEIVRVRDSTMIRPAKETPKHSIQTCDLDLLVPAAHIPALHFYRRPPSNGSSSSSSSLTNFFEADLLKEGLSKVLVPFYPMAGRLGIDQNGRFEIFCNGEGVLFIEAESSCAIDDFGDLSSSFDIVQLVPAFDYTNHVSSYPLIALQVTHFKCGGVCLGIRQHHTLGDATAKYYFIKAWAEMTRGNPIGITPFFDRSSARLTVGGVPPPSPKFHHIEYDPPPSMSPPPLPAPAGSFSTAILELSLDQINALKEKSNKEHGPTTVRYSRFEIITAHIWRCMCTARCLPDDQLSKLHIPTNGRPRLDPAIQPGYIGNVVFTMASLALSGDIVSEPLHSTVERVHKTLKRMDDEYLNSALAYLKQLPDLTVLRRGPHTFQCPNLNVVNLTNMSMHDADFGWGKPFFARPVNATFEGIAYIVSSPRNDGGLSVILNLETKHMQLFKSSFYEIFQPQHIARPRSRF